MAKKKSAKPETKSEFLRRVLTKKPDLDSRQVNDRWVKAGHSGTISPALFYSVRRELGIRTEWTWVRSDEPGPKPPPTAPTEASGEVYQFKITLLDAQPPIWRRIQVVDETLDRLHEHIQTAMGWTNSHMHQFRIGGNFYCDPRLMVGGIDELESLDSTMVRLSEILDKLGQRPRFHYEYDFGDGWIHEIELESRGPMEAGKRYPICLEGKRACPPEDVGGIWGYMEFLAIIADPKHEQYHESREWIGRKFDPEAFSPEAATRRMRSGLPSW